MIEDLSPEDSFRLQVLLAQDLRAVRIEESEASPVLHALTDKGEASIPLSPNCRLDKYLRLIRELLSGHALGSPGGYPVYLSRWTRHGQMEGLNLGRLLLTGEPEAVVAVVHSPALTDELARDAWWAMPSIENARLMLGREKVARGTMGPVLADFLVEHLPFLQDEHLDIMDTVVVLLYSGALSDDSRVAIWRRGKQVNTHYVAFLEVAGWERCAPGPETTPEPPPEGAKSFLGRPGERLAGRQLLPLPLPARADRDLRLADMALLLESGDLAAHALARALEAQGQTFLAAAEAILERPETQEVVNRTLNALGRYFSAGVAEARDESRMNVCQALEPHLEAAARLARMSEEQVAPIFARSTAIGSLMRRKIEPVVSGVLADIRLLRGE
ncbi:MAG: hypothetical protein PHD37_13680 [Gallionellaceae bacterium]|nr:hypothetical protein [Gallionellaceae bacterium]